MMPQNVVAYCRPNPGRNYYAEKGLIGETFYWKTRLRRECFVFFFCNVFQYYHLRCAWYVHVYLQTKPVTLASLFWSRLNFHLGLVPLPSQSSCLLQWAVRPRWKSFSCTSMANNNDNKYNFESVLLVWICAFHWDFGFSDFFLLISLQKKCSKMGWDRKDIHFDAF